MTDNTELLAAIADAGSREHVLRQLQATNSMAEMDARTVASEEGLSADAHPSEVAMVFVDAWNSWRNDTMTDEEYREWLETVEDRYGVRGESTDSSPHRDGELVRHSDRADEIL